MSRVGPGRNYTRRAGGSGVVDHERSSVVIRFADSSTRVCRDRRVFSVSPTGDFYRGSPPPRLRPTPDPSFVIRFTDSSRLPAGSLVVRLPTVFRRRFSICFRSSVDRPTRRPTCRPATSYPVVGSTPGLPSRGVRVCCVVTFSLRLEFPAVCGELTLNS